MAVAVDESLALAEQHLRANGKWDNTLILFMSDNGGSLNKDCPNQPMKAGKYSNQEGGIHVRSAMGGGYLPSVLHGSETRTVMHFVDFWPTFSYLAGVSTTTKPGEPGIDGKNVAPSWRKLYSSNGADNEYISDANNGRVIIHATGEWRRGRAFSYVTKTAVWKLFGDLGSKGQRPCANFGGKCVWESLPNQGTTLVGCSNSNPCVFDVSSDRSESVMKRLNSPGVPTELKGIAQAAFAHNARARTTYWVEETQSRITFEGKDCTTQACNAGYQIEPVNGVQYVEGCFNGYNGKLANDILAAQNRWVLGPYREGEGNS